MRYVTLFTCALTLLACVDATKDTEQESTLGFLSLDQVQGQASVADCPNGGQFLEHGVDQNGNGTLDAAEVKKTYVPCNGANGTKDDPGEKGFYTKKITVDGDKDTYHPVSFKLGWDLDEDSRSGKVHDVFITRI